MSASVLPPHERRVEGRQRRQLLTFLVLIAVVILVGVLALGNWMQWWTIGGRAQEAVPLTCPTQTVSAPSLTRVNVYNGTTRFGLAGAVAKELQARGFTVLSIATEKQAKPLRSIAVIRYGPAGTRQARTVALQFPGKVVMTQDDRNSRTVDVVIGNRYREMLARKQALTAIAPTPLPAGCVPATTAVATPEPSAVPAP